MYSVEIRRSAGRQFGPTQLGMQMQRCDLGAVKSSSKFTKAPPVSRALLARGVTVATVEEAAADASISRATAYRYASEVMLWSPQAFPHHAVADGLYGAR